MIPTRLLSSCSPKVRCWHLSASFLIVLPWVGSESYSAHLQQDEPFDACSALKSAVMQCRALQALPISPTHPCTGLTGMPFMPAPV